MKIKDKRMNRYISGLNGLRAFAVIGVIFYHLLPSTFKGGYLGVPVFFVISGYLITDLLHQEWLTNETIDLKSFYKRRLRRLYPGLVTMLLLSSSYIVLFQRSLLNNLRSILATSLLYVNNWWQIIHGFSYFDRFSTPSPFTHLWSLAVEGQNYLLWPLIFLLLMRLVKKPKQQFLVILGLAFLSAIWMALLYEPGQDPTRVYYGTDTRLFSILLGNALAMIWPSYRLKEAIPQKARYFLNGAGITSLVLLGLAFLFLADYLPFVYYGGLFLISLLAVVCVAVVVHPGSDLNRWLTNPIFTWLGQRSYGIYLYQFPVMIFYEAKIKNISQHSWLHTLIELALILGISECSYRWIEQPLKKMNYHQLWEQIQQFYQQPHWQPALIKYGVGLLFVGLTLFAAVIAPSNFVTADQQKMQEQIAANKAKADARKQALQTGDSTEETTSETPDTEGTAPNDTLSATELEQAKNIELTAFGDSVILDVAEGLHEVFPKSIVDGEVGRQLYASNEALTKLAEEDLLKENVLMGLGTNGSFTEAQFDEIMAILGTKRNVYWVNVHVPTRRWQNDVNDMLSAMEKKYSNLKVLDWFTYSENHDDWFYEDQVHPNIEGQTVYAHFIAKQILENQ